LITLERGTRNLLRFPERELDVVQAGCAYPIRMDAYSSLIESLRRILPPCSTDATAHLARAFAININLGETDEDVQVPQGTLELEARDQKPASMATALRDPTRTN
jgi:hypothetical protein